MKQKRTMGLICALLMALLCVCNASLVEETSWETENGGETEEHAVPVGGEESGVRDMEIPQTGWTQAVPAEYTQAAAEQGTVVRLDYESEDYVRDGSPITSYHDFNAVQEYLYNALPLFFRDGDPGNAQTASQPYATGTILSDVINDSAFGEYGRLLFPVDAGYFRGDTLGGLIFHGPSALFLNTRRNWR